MPIPFTKLVASLPAATPFVGPETLQRLSGRPFKARIGANESAFGLSPLARQAMHEALEQCAWYGDPENHDLRSALAERHAVGIDEICVDAGIDSLLGLLVRMLVSTGDPVVTSQGAYPTLNYHISGFGGEICRVPYCDDREDPVALFTMAARVSAPLVYLANPDNPMGTWHTGESLVQAFGHLPDGCVLALDEAYAEFAPPATLPPIDTRDRRVVRLRTFSKAYGMAGARIGYAIAHPDIVTGLNKIRNHFAVNRLAQAGALAALRDEGFLRQVQQQVEQGRQRLYRLAARCGLHALPSATNFVAVDLGSAQRASAMLARMADNDIFIRMPGVAPLNRCIRIGVGSAAEFAHLEPVFARELAALPALAR
ncbi:MAG: aminotransferase class I/II-fold pyridoxal phosphate-dependent enzyme [Burkholderiaceae bacterium]